MCSFITDDTDSVISLWLAMYIPDTQQNGAALVSLQNYPIFQ